MYDTPNLNDSVRAGAIAEASAILKSVMDEHDPFFDTISGWKDQKEWDADFSPADTKGVRFFIAQVLLKAAETGSSEYLTEVLANWGGDSLSEDSYDGATRLRGHYDDEAN